MVQKILQLMVYRKCKRSSNVVFKSGDREFRIEGMLEGLRFVANMEQLRLAINSGGGKESWFELENGNDKMWSLEVRCLNGVVSINLWSMNDGDGAFTDFSWDGSVGEFDRAVRRLVSFEKIH